MNEIFSAVMRVAHATADRSPSSHMPGSLAEGGDRDRRGDRGRAFMPLGIQVFSLSLSLSLSLSPLPAEIASNWSAFGG